MIVRYWDACVVLGLLLKEPDKYDTCRQIIQEAERGECQISTSAYSLVEVVHLGKRSGLTQDQEAMIRDFFEGMMIYQIDREIGTYARELMWRHSELSHKDSLHVATALTAEVDVLETYDPGILALDGVTLDGHTLRIRQPVPANVSLFPHGN